MMHAGYGNFFLEPIQRKKSEISTSQPSIQINQRKEPQQQITNLQKQVNLQFDSRQTARVLRFNSTARYNNSNKKEEEEKIYGKRDTRNINNTVISNNYMNCNMKQQKGFLNQSNQKQGITKKSLEKGKNSNTPFIHRGRKYNNRQSQGQKDNEENKSEEQKEKEQQKDISQQEPSIEEIINVEETDSDYCSDFSQESILKDCSELNFNYYEQNNYDNKENSFKEEKKQIGTKDYPQSAQALNSKNESSSSFQDNKNDNRSRNLKQKAIEESNKYQQKYGSNSQGQTQTLDDIPSTVFCDLCFKEFIESEYLDHCKLFEFKNNPLKEKETNGHFLNYIKILLKSNQQLKQQNHKLQEKYQQLLGQLQLGQQPLAQQSRTQQQLRPQQVGQQRLAPQRLSQRQLGQQRVGQLQYQSQQQRQVLKQIQQRQSQLQQRQQLIHRLQQQQEKQRQQKHQILLQRRREREEKAQRKQEQLQENLYQKQQIQKERFELVVHERRITQYYQQERQQLEQQRKQRREQENKRQQEQLQQEQDQRYEMEFQREIFRQRQIRWQQEQRWQEDQRKVQQQQRERQNKERRMHRSQTAISFKRANYLEELNL